MQGAIPNTHDLNLGMWSETTENITNTSTRTHKHGYYIHAKATLTGIDHGLSIYTLIIRSVIVLQAVLKL